MTLLPLVLAIVSTAGAQVLYRLFFLRQEKIYLVATIGLFCLAPGMSYLALKHWPMSTVYMSTGLTYALVLALAKLLLGETISRRKMQAMLLIVGGVVIFNL
jgi:multidrug transporter EmrE-like cation transporter